MGDLIVNGADERRAPVSVVIAARDAGEHITDCIASVIDWAAETIVVENDSIDDTLDHLQNIGGIDNGHGREPIKDVSLDRAYHLGFDAQRPIIDSRKVIQ